MFLYTAAINVTKVIVNIPPSDAEQIPLILNLQDDNIVEPVDFYQLTIVNVSDPNVIIGDINTTFIIVNDDDEVVDEGKILINDYMYWYIDTYIDCTHVCSLLGCTADHFRYIGQLY